MANFSSYNEFTGYIKSTGLAIGSHFTVILPSLGSNGSTKDVSMKCEVASLPGINIMTSEIRAFGETTEYAYGVNYPPIQLTFFITNDFDVKEYFNSWLQSVFDTRTRSVGYYKDYAKPLTISMSDKEGNETYKIVLHEAYPKAINDISLAYSDNAPIKLNVSVQYKWWSNDDAEPAEEEIMTDTESSLNFTGVVDGLNVGAQASFSNPFNSNLPTSIGAGISDVTNRLQSLPYVNVGAALVKNGPIIGSDILSISNLCSKSFYNTDLTTPDGVFGDASKLLGNLTKSLGSGFNEFGGGLVNLGKNLTALTAPVSALKGSISSISGTLNNINSLANTLGIKNTGLSKVVTNLNRVNSKLNSVSKLSAVSAGLSGVGAGMTSINTGLRVLSETITTLPGSTSDMENTLSKLGDMIGLHSSNVNNTASELLNLGD